MATKFEEMSKNAVQEQRRVLRRILQENAMCEYLCTLGVGTPTELACMDDKTLETRFKQCVPVVSYVQMRPFILRILDGDLSPILMCDPIRALSLSSGTSEGQEKYIPYYDGLKIGTVEVALIASAYRNRVYPLSSGAKVLEFLFSGKLSTTKGGLKLGVSTTKLIHDNVFKMRQNIWGLTSCCPDKVELASDFAQGMYCHLLCGLVYKDDVEVLSAVFAYTLVEALRTLEVEWKNLCYDIKYGHLDSKKVTDPSLRAAMKNKVLICPNAKLADQIETICREKSLQCSWNGIVKQLWPRCKYLLSIMTGSMEAYVPTLQGYTGDSVPLVSADYGATEGWVAANINPCSPPHQVSFTIIPSLGYFEFIPLSKSKNANNATSSLSNVSDVHAFDQATPINLTEVKLGQDYEIVMTTSGGLYRYILGDILRVTGYFHGIPQFSYVCRKNVILSISVDKVSEEDLKLVVSKATSVLQYHSTIKVVDYTSYADNDYTHQHYVIFWEVQGGEVSSQASTYLFEKCATLMDSNILEPGYVLSRKMGTIKALELRIVEQGSFKKILESLMDRVGASITQYKTPRCILKSFPDVLSILHENTIAKYFSSATFSNVMHEHWQTTSKLQENPLPSTLAFQASKACDTLVTKT